MKFNINPDKVSIYSDFSADDPRALPQIQSRGDYSWWLVFSRLGPGAVIGPLAHQGYALLYLKCTLREQVILTEAEKQCVRDAIATNPNPKAYLRGVLQNASYPAPWDEPMLDELLREGSE